MGSRIAFVFGIVFVVLIVNSCFAQVIQYSSVIEEIHQNYFLKNQKLISILLSVQLTFSPNWGKRSALNQLDFGNSAGSTLNSNGINADSSMRFGAMHGASNANGNNCKPSIDSLTLIYRMIQVNFYFQFVSDVISKDIYSFRTRWKLKNWMNVHKNETSFQ